MKRVRVAVFILLLSALALSPFVAAENMVLTQTFPSGTAHTGGSPPPPPNNPNGGPFTTPGTSLLIIENWWTNVVSFKANIGPNVTAVTWYFGDGKSASGVTTTHTYPVSGFYQSFQVRAHICTPTDCEDIWQTVNVVNGPLVVLAGLASVGAVLLGLGIVAVLKHPPRMTRGFSRSKVLRRRLELGGRVHARSLARVKSLRIPRMRGRV